MPTSRDSHSSKGIEGAEGDSDNEGRMENMGNQDGTFMHVASISCLRGGVRAPIKRGGVRAEEEESARRDSGLRSSESKTDGDERGGGA